MTSCIVALVIFAGLPGFVATASSASDLLPPSRREVSVEIATRLSRPPVPEPVPEELPQPFNPPDFSQPDPEEVKAAAAAGLPPPAQAPAAPGLPAAPAGPASDREILVELSSRLNPSGTLVLGGKPLLIIGTNRFEVGTRFGVVFNNQDYELELVSIDRTTFTLRYRNEETTRPF